MNRKFRSLRGNESKIAEFYDEMYGKYKFKQNKILYPETSLLDEFMKDRGLSKKMKNNIAIINGEAQFVSKAKKYTLEDGRASNFSSSQNDNKNFFSNA